MGLSASPACEEEPVPTYQYACTECGERLEVVQKFTDDPLTVCSACGGKLRKLFSAVGIVFKGSGFYRTDSRNGSSSNGSNGGKKAETAASSGDSGSKPDSGTKPAESGASKKTDSAGAGSSASSGSSSGAKVA
jgi:putative FmdB family regulatory protein